MADSIGLALGGGGARGLAHIGLLRVLQREQIPVSFIAGTSMGGLVGALFAAGLPLEEVEAEVKRYAQVREQLKLVDVSLSSAGLSVQGRRIYNFLADLLGETLLFSDLNIPTAMASVDILSGQDIVLQGGLVIDAVRATISVPGIFTPVDLGGYRLVDGGVLNNVPVDVARALGDAPIVAVDVLPTFNDNVPGQPAIVEGLQLPIGPVYINETYNVLMIMIAAITDERLKQYPPDLTHSADTAAGYHPAGGV
ncbi:MAG: patatin-like phospholipase family protein [Chloroflexota bacterium]